MDRAIKILLIITGIIAVVSVAFSGIVFYKNKNNQVGGIKQNELLIASNFGNESVAEKLNVRDWKTYRNEEYGFALGFPVSWDGYVINDKVLQTAYNHDQKKYSFHEIKFLYPQSKSKSGKSGDVYFSIGIFDRGNWSIGENDSWHKLGENNQFVFAGLPSLGAAPDELDERMREIPDIIESFKFIANTSDWKTYRDEKCGFEMKYPSGWKLTEGVLGAYFTSGETHICIGQCATEYPETWKVEKSYITIDGKNNGISKYYENNKLVSLNVGLENGSTICDFMADFSEQEKADEVMEILKTIKFIK